MLALGSFNDLSQFSYRQLAERLGVTHAAQVRHHLIQLEKTGKLVRNPDGSLTTPKDGSRFSAGKLLSIPILGEVDCGVATKFASDNITGYLSVSPASTRYRDSDNIFALKACGDSMDMSDINGKGVNNSDYVLVKKNDGEDVRDGEYVVSLIDGCANLKKFRKDRINQRIALTSESSKDYPPIFIDERDEEYYQVIGKAVDVIKGLDHLS